MKFHPFLTLAVCAGTLPLPAGAPGDDQSAPAASAPAPAAKPAASEPAPATPAPAETGFWAGREPRATEWAERLWAAPASAAIDFDENTLLLKPADGADAPALEAIKDGLESAFDDEFEDDVKLEERGPTDWQLDLVVIDHSPTALVYDLILRDRAGAPLVAARLRAEAKKESQLSGKVEAGCAEFVAILKKGRALKAYQGK